MDEPEGEDCKRCLGVPTPNRIRTIGCLHGNSFPKLAFDILDAYLPIVPQSLDFPISELPNVGLDLVADLETKLIRHNAFLEAILQKIMIEVLADEDEDVFTLGSGIGKGGERT